MSTSTTKLTGLFLLLLLIAPPVFADPLCDLTLQKMKNWYIDTYYVEINEKIDFHEGLVTAWTGKLGDPQSLWGYVSSSNPKEWFIRPQFKSGREFSEGRAVVYISRETTEPNRAGIIDRTGNYILTPQYNDISDFHDGIAIGKKTAPKEQWDIIGSDGKILFSSTDYIIYSSQSYPYGLIPFIRKKDYKHGYINKNGKIIIQPIYSGASIFGDHDLAVVTKEVNKINLSGYIDPKGKIIIKPQFEEAEIFFDNLAIVKSKGLYGFINPQGKFAIEPKFISIKKFKGDLAAVQVEEYWDNDVPLSKTWGYINKKGDWAIPPIYKKATSFKDGIAFVENDAGETIMINQTGTKICEDIKIN